MNELEFRLLNDYQRGFPLCAEPFREIAGRLGATEEAVLAAYARLAVAGALSRIGAVFRPNVVGASTLAALRVPRQRLEEVAARVSARPEVHHNYEREHEWNLWFVAAAADRARLERVLDGIECECALLLLRLPLEEDFHIDLGFDLRDGSVPARGAARPPVARALAAAERRLLGALQDGLPLVSRPYARLGEQAGLAEPEVLALLASWIAQGLVRRFGTVLRHRALGYGANAMVVWDVPEPEVARAGRALARSDAVTLCYRRPRVPPHWTYNLFCMIHGRDRAGVLERVAALRAQAGLESVRHEVLFSRRCFKQNGARYVEEAGQPCSA